MSNCDTPKLKAVYYSILKYQPENLKLLHEAFDITELPTPADDMPVILQDADVCFAPLGYQFDKEKMASMPKLKAIVTNTTGIPHVDAIAAQYQNIEVISLANDTAFLETITPTAEHTWGLLLALLRNMPAARISVLDGKWDRRPFPGSAMLSRLSIGIIGLGRLGKMVARYAEAFGMQVRYYDPYVELEDSSTERVNSLEDLVSVSDVISLHVPANDETWGMLSRAVINQFKPGAYFINTARGELVDDTALLEALKEGRIAGAALDVLSDEFNPAFDPKACALINYAREHDNLLLTPHIGGSTIDAWRETEHRVIDRAIQCLGIEMNND